MLDIINESISIGYYLLQSRHYSSVLSFSLISFLCPIQDPKKGFPRSLLLVSFLKWFWWLWWFSEGLVRWFYRLSFNWNLSDVFLIIRWAYLSMKVKYHSYCTTSRIHTISMTSHCWSWSWSWSPSWGTVCPTSPLSGSSFPIHSVLYKEVTVYPRGNELHNYF
jgi:hypothetical protein